MDPVPGLDLSLPPFDLLDDAGRRRLQASVDIGFHPGGTTLIEAGKASPHVFVILKGLVHAFQVDDRGRAERFAEGATQGIHLVDRRDLALTDERVEPAHRVTSRRATRGPNWRLVRSVMRKATG